MDGDGNLVKRSHRDYNRHMARFIVPFAQRLAPRDGDPDKDTDASTVAPHTNIAVKSKPVTKKPSMYKVFLLNDDYTPMEFVVQVLETFFNKTREEATRIMLHVHQKGLGLCGVFTYEVAETKITQVMSAAKQAQHPLQCTMEKE
jgi:ATP-dependent Clp protease adaptor protein ClpS